MWKEDDPLITFSMQRALQSYRHELLVDNCAGIPMILQHGSADDNVPPFQSRRMNQLISHSAEDFPTKYVEMDGKGHWFDGVMTTAALRRFYADVLSGGIEVPAIPLEFSIIIANPADMGSRGGLVVDQLKTPDKLGRIDVKRASLSAWNIRTFNVHRFHFVSCISAVTPSQLKLDSDSISLPVSHELGKSWLVQSACGHWKVWTRTQEWCVHQLTITDLS